MTWSQPASLPKFETLDPCSLGALNVTLYPVDPKPRTPNRKPEHLRPKMFILNNNLKPQSRNQTEHFSGAELAGLVRSAASFALARSALDDSDAQVTPNSDL